jgi:hypothetical protein
MEYGAYTVWGLSVLTLFAFCCCYASVKLGIAVFKTTAQYVQANMHIFLLPIFGSITLVIWLSLWIVSFAWLYTVGDPKPRDIPLNFLTNIAWTDLTTGVVAYHIFGLFWINSFIMGVN